MAEVRRLLSKARVVTLTGPGGVGKTRLALRVAADVQRAFPDGVWLVELAGLKDPELLGASVNEALAIRDTSRRPLMEVLVDHLRDKRALLILDNCEHLLRGCAVLAEILVRSAPSLRILTTSRQALGIAAEQTLAVPTLPLPPPVPDSDRPRLPAEPATQSEAVRLFAERAAAVIPDFTVTDANRSAVEQICRRLDGIPLAIELATARLRALSPEELLARLDDRFRLLTGGSPATLPRQQTLRALIDWSYALCTEKEQLLWARVSVFADGLDLEAAEAVCSGAGIDREEAIDLVIGLVDKSILIKENPPATPSVTRYRLLETIRQYGRERLAALGQETRLRRLHRDHYRRLSAKAYAQRFGPSQVAWFGRLDLEHANLRTALEYCFTDPEETSAALGMATDLLYHWITSHYLSEGRHWLDRSLLAVTGPDEIRGRALWSNSWLAIIQADVVSATAMLEEARALGNLPGHEPVLAYVTLYSGMIAMFRGDVEAAIELYREAAARHLADDDPTGLALTLIRLCLAHSFLGDWASSISAGEECLTLCDAHGESWHRAYAMMALGVGVWAQGDARRATELEKESLRFNRSLDDLLGVGVNLEVLAWITAAEGNHRRAAVLLGILETIWQAVGAPMSGFGHLMYYHDECEARTREALGKTAFDAAARRGAKLPGEEALAFALDEGTRSGGPPDRAAPSPSPLTRRETEIAQLVAQGLSNKEIATSLTIAQRTAEGHIEHIMTKLGFHSRAQIAVWIGERNRDVNGNRASGT
ncbi:LuxR C-terminal-related transcriptional regulator [Streptosporangium sp. NBC_01755]|uniref:ATP-binding protein n=1 Tax=unclassified Streptosporangium TaxID=2632669 RepID=UPI002DDC464C|nr:MULTISPECIES: LuxR C-terminal-related transcriptional regulator [unclassified Streptosporangium]WSA23561.1 LuxR C-terminal-related transcriptional regulator [Streptosporangium sp. NBC_01810]WSC98229.1 LuxR C-terminal-related transcriptional regulator [Streptosporangium sp. NBC_01755]